MSINTFANDATERGLVTDRTPAPRHASGKGSHLAPDERQEIQRAHLEDDLNRSELAVRFGRTRKAIARALEGEDFKKREGQLAKGMVETARRTLMRGVRKGRGCLGTHDHREGASPRQSQAREGPLDS